MDKNVLVSVIIPAYNAENYIGRCLDSLLVQSISDIEILCIDDGSQDKTGEICENYKSKDSRVKVYHIENNGVSNARNFGLTKIRGEWFAFVDSDDWVEPNYLSLLYDNAQKYSCDASACSYQTNTEYCLGHNEDNIETYVFSSVEECIHSFICQEHSLQGQVWNKLYRAQLFKDIQFDTKHKVNEDCLYTYEVMNRCSGACLTTAELYHWSMRADSASHNKALSCDFLPANVFVELLKKTECLKDKEVNSFLKRNYVESVLRIFLLGDIDWSDEKVKEAKSRCVLWKRDAWPYMDLKMRIKYNIAMHCSWLGKLI